MSQIKNAAGPLAILFGAAAIGLTVLGAATAQMGVNPLMTDHDGAKRTVENAGFSNVKTTGYGWFACGVGESADLWRTRFTATNQNGQAVDGVVCSSILKSATIRYD